MRFPHVKCVIEETGIIELTVASCHFNFKMIRPFRQSSTAFIKKKNHFRLMQNCTVTVNHGNIYVIKLLLRPDIKKMASAEDIQRTR